LKVFIFYFILMINLKNFRPKVLEGDDDGEDDDDVEEVVGRTGPDGRASLFSPGGTSWVPTPLPWFAIPVAVVAHCGAAQPVRPPSPSHL